ncbi:FAD/NAD(P)-binding protein [Allonocardiopsis opalescens]|uniref:Putative NAD(P)/FAD-binding protein YdhS n=1 Tax=Allonocardiopsis opalescens TaxID=1144618 RepID=A0A2T0Q4K3_9ACTN|nr:FAD/NAD(P)-binding protein [Allonocardiopsis opalescens]PRX98689.1 putative NAD(P)/FAD-binding protein YdhS [Allonocardiopsis opalescens]
MREASSTPAERGPVLAFAGGGAAAALTAAYVLRAFAAARARGTVVLVDRLGRHARGTAYATTDPGHLLNAPACAMTAYGGDQEHLVEWARDQGLVCDHRSFLSRSLYGDYLHDVLADAERLAERVRVERRTARVLAVRPGGVPGRRWTLELSGGGAVHADQVVLAPGLPAAADPRVPGLAGLRRGGPYLPDPWAPGVLAAAGDGRPVLALGTGLTMVDVALSATAADPRTVVYAVSRRGLLPQRHAFPLTGYHPRVALPDGPLRVADLMRALRTAVAADPLHWRYTVDSLRPELQRLWARLGPAEQRRFLDRVARYWEVHRHRMAPTVAERLDRLRLSGRLRVMAGRVASVRATPSGLRASVEPAGGGRTEIDAGWLVNCTGPSAAAAGDPLLRRLLADGLAGADRHGLGLDTSDDGELMGPDGRCREGLFTLGATRRGQLYETTAIREIRAQAEVVARRTAEALLAAPAAWG